MRSVKKLSRDLSDAGSYEEWYRLATEIDEISGAMAWRESRESNLYHSDLLIKQLDSLRQCREADDSEALMPLLIESLYRHLGEISHPKLYQRAFTGTQFLVQDYLKEVCLCIKYLEMADFPGMSREEKLAGFQQAYQNYGKTALVLSGGAAFGIYHLGVVKAIWQAGLLPDVFSGSSMGAIVAAGICARDDAELVDFFAHPERIHREALQLDRLDKVTASGCIMSSDKLFEHIEANVGKQTFAEAYQHSGRILNVTVSPTRAFQKPRILSHMTAPDVLIPYAALASCAIPGVFPPVALKAKTQSGLVNYMETETWIDGSVHSDVPLMRMSRLHNINHTIVSQANPHVLPFITHKNQHGMVPFIKRAAASIAHAQTAEVLEIARDLMGNNRWRPLLDKAYGMARQTYLGDINIHFPFKPALYRKVASNPDWDDLQMYIRLGEQATWPRISEIADQTLVGRALKRSLDRLGNY